MGTAESYSAIIGGASLTNSGETTLAGDLGFSPTGAITQNGTLSYLALHNGDAAASQAFTDIFSDMGTAYADALRRDSTPNSFPAAGGGNFVAGVYNQGGAAAPSGLLTLDGQNDPNSVFIFQIGGAFAPSGEMKLINGAQSGNVFWQVDGAVAPGAKSVTVGTIMAIGAFSMGANATLDGRILVTAAGTFSSNTITTSSPMTAPGAPTGVSATAGDRQATLTFTPPTNTGGSEIIDYSVTVNGGTPTITTSSSPITISGLTNGTAYTFTVTARNSIGTSTSSTPSNSVTPVAEPVPVPVPTPLPAPVPAPTPVPVPVPVPVPAPTPVPVPVPVLVSPPPLGLYSSLFLAARPPLGAAIAFLDSEAMSVAFTVNRVNGTVTMSDEDVWIRVGSPSTAEAKKALDSAGTPVLIDGGVLVSSCSGMLPGTELYFYLANEEMALSLGQFPVSSVGTCAGAIRLPNFLTEGTYTLSMASLVTDTRQEVAVTRVLSTSIQVNVKETDTKEISQPTSKQDARKETIQFNAYSANLTKDSKRQLDILVKQLPTKIDNFVRIVGFVGPGGSASHVSKLSNARSKSVARYLKSKGVRGTYVLESGGNSVKTSKLAQNAKVTIYPNQ